MGIGVRESVGHEARCRGGFVILRKNWAHCDLISLARCIRTTRMFTLSAILMHDLRKRIHTQN